MSNLSFPESYGERLLPQVLDNDAKSYPDRFYATIAQSSSFETTYRDVTTKEMATAVNYLAWWLKTHSKDIPTHQCLAYIGSSDLRYPLICLAAMKCSLKILLPGPRNSMVQNQSLLSRAKCFMVVYAPEMVRVVDALKHGLTGKLSFMAIQPLDHILSASAPPFPYERKFSEIVHEPAIIVHSSGSTGDPKLISMTHGTFSVTDNDRNIPTPPGRRPQNGAQFHFKDGGRFYSSFPPYHLAGLQSFLILPVFYGATIIVGPPGLPPSGQLVGSLVRKWKKSMKAFYVPPSIIEQWAQEPDVKSLAISLEFILYGGGPLSPTVGNFLSQHTSVCQMYGSTEMGQLQLLIPLSNEWEYLEFNPYEEVDMQESHDGGYELVLHQEKRFAKSRCLSHTLPHIKEWRTGDLFKRHPRKQNLWKFYTRLDDLILLSTGHKINSTAIELNLASHPLISGSIVVGTGRPSPAILIEVKSVEGLHDEDIMHSIWTAIEEGNQLVPEFARITRSRIGLGVPSKPFYRNPKGTIVRSLTISSYEKEIDELFNRYRVTDYPVLHSTSPEAIMGFIRQTIQSVLPPASPCIDDAVDLFSLGLDSLKVGEVVQIMSHGLKKYSDVPIDTKMIYQSPTLVQLSEKILESLSPGVSWCLGPKIENIHTQLPKLVRKYAPRAQKFQQSTPVDRLMMASVQRIAVNNEKLQIILTGSTGLVGRAILNVLAKTPGVEKIYCFTRSGSLGPPAGFSNNPSIVILEADFRKERFGLSNDVYATMLTNVNVVVHVAWTVNFNLAVQSYEDDHLNGLRSLVEFCLASKLSYRPRIIFTSSTSYAFDWAVANNVAQIPERILDAFDDSFGSGYGQSKQVAEHILFNASNLYDLPVTIIRMGQVAQTAVSRREEVGKNDWVSSLVQTSESLHVVPSARFLVDWILVNDVAQIISELLISDTVSDQSEDGIKDNKSPFRLYNIVNPHPVPWQIFASAIQDNMQIDRIIPLSDWLNLLSLSYRESEMDRMKFMTHFPALKIYHFLEHLAKIDERSHAQVRFDVAGAQSSSIAMANLRPIDMTLLGCWIGA